MHRFQGFAGVLQSEIALGADKVTSPRKPQTARTSPIDAAASGLNGVSCGAIGLRADGQTLGGSGCKVEQRADGHLFPGIGWLRTGNGLRNCARSNTGRIQFTQAHVEP